MPEAFQARFPVPVKSRSCLRPSADETKLPVAGEKKALVPRVEGGKRRPEIRLQFAG